MKEFLSKYKVLILHVSFWILYFSYRFYDVQAYFGYEKAWIYLSIPLFFNLIASYSHYFLILPPWIKNKKHLSYFIKLAFLLAIIITIRIQFESHFYKDVMPNENYFKTVTFTRIFSTLWDTLTFLIFTGMIRFTLDWFDLENKKKQLENEKLVAELNFLKAQINPHFLFNTLHNLNYLIYSGSKKATDVIIKLSNIMRYMIYDANKENVLLKKEIEYMNDYIHLESIRLNQKFIIDFKIEGNINGVEIAPLIMITFLENAFKHGVSDQEGNCWINVKLMADENSIQYQVSNKKLKPSTTNKLKSGFGLNNVKKRLELSYPEKYQLTISDLEDVYNVDLTLRRI
jgi:sensor histidine kinase YesM